MSLKLEVGKTYSCFNGSLTYKIIHQLAGGGFPFVGVFGTHVGQFSVDGRAKDTGRNSSLIKEFVEPRSKSVFLTWYEDSTADGKTLFTSTTNLKPNTEQRIALRPGLKILAIKEVTITEGEGLNG